VKNEIIINIFEITKTPINTVMNGYSMENFNSSSFSIKNERNEIATKRLIREIRNQMKKQMSITLLA
jgi:hypothetical protein